MTHQNPPPGDPEPSIGFRWGDLFPDKHPERRRSPRERGAFFTTATLLVLAVWVCSFVGPFLLMSDDDEGAKQAILVIVAILGPVTIGVVALLVSVFRFKRARLAWPIPLVGIALMALNMLIYMSVA
jgi:hypothetical protein